jgi:hypothetical protein
MQNASLTVSSIQGFEELIPYDLSICALGFESRCTNHAELLARRSHIHHAIGFVNGRNEKFEENKKVFTNLHFTVSMISDAGFKAYVREILNNQPQPHSPIRICVDISSFSRMRIATILEVIDEHSDPSFVDFVYTVGAYSKPIEFEGLTLEVGPVTSRFAGWSNHPDPTLECIVGLGFETGRAIGAIDVIEATSVHVFNPKSDIHEYEPEVERANSSLLDVVGFNEWVNYDVCEPYQLFEKLESMVAMKKDESSVVIFPFGPKIFALVSLIVGLLHPEVSVWRISHGPNTPIIDREASELSVYLRLAMPGSSERFRLSETALSFEQI